MLAEDRKALSHSIRWEEQTNMSVNTGEFNNTLVIALREKIVSLEMRLSI